MLLVIRVLVKQWRSARQFYEIYSDGYTIQGGEGNVVGDGSTLFTCHVPFKDTNYSILTNFAYEASTGTDASASAYVKDKSHFYLRNGINVTSLMVWYAYGYGTVPTQSDWVTNLGHSPLKYLLKY